MKPNPKASWNADRLDVRAFAQAGACLEAQEPLSRFGRLSGEMMPGAADAARAVAWQARGELRPAASGGESAVWLQLTARTVVPLSCQRCLGAAETPLEVDRWFRFVADEATAEQEDDECEEDVLALEPRPSLHELLEDELLMALPLVPMHDTCPEPVVMQAGDAALLNEAEPVPRRHPFAELAKLRK
ncbi:MAG: hypothetical protein C0443_10045 [Comamonadaceae bacterium]|nr:hypothetical protein [Comamonadaceae bacterium]